MKIQRNPPLLLLLLYSSTSLLITNISLFTSVYADENQCHHQYSTENNENELQSDFKKYTITGLSHELYKKSGGYSDEEMFEQFIHIVESQTQYNTDNAIRAIPILIYHSVDYSGDDYSINPGLFEKEMKHLFENGYKIFQMNDIVYDNEEGLHIKGH